MSGCQKITNNLTFVVFLWLIYFTFYSSSLIRMSTATKNYTSSCTNIDNFRRQFFCYLDTGDIRCTSKSLVMERISNTMVLLPINQHCHSWREQNLHAMYKCPKYLEYMTLYQVDRRNHRTVFFKKWRGDVVIANNDRSCEMQWT